MAFTDAQRMQAANLALMQFSVVHVGTEYIPTIWNDSGIYTYFYIDFLSAMQEFTFGMFSESIIVYDSVQISVTAVEKVSASVCKVYANIASLPHGVTVINKKTSKLKFSSGESVPAFSIHMFVAGQVAYIDGGYYCEKAAFDMDRVSANESNAYDFYSAIDGGSIAETAAFALIGGVSETPTITLT